MPVVSEICPITLWLFKISFFLDIEFSFKTSRYILVKPRYIFLTTFKSKQNSQYKCSTHRNIDRKIYQASIYCELAGQS